MIDDWISTADKSWSPFLNTQLPLLKSIEDTLLKTSSSERIIPLPSKVLRCLSLPVSKIKVVIVGQDPYPNAQHACGLAFGLENQSLKLPKSLENIRRELISDMKCQEGSYLDLSKWHDAGVLLLNRVLTVNVGESNSHCGIGWEEFTKNLLTYLDSQMSLVAILWGKSAQELEHYMPKARIIKSVHPSPLSAYRGFFGSKPFSEVNRLLIDQNQTPIRWCDALLPHE
ncbi:MAG: hypothetical protein RL228_925 [Actinomycetota bacterium]